jgi:hypothetical protein
MSTNFGGRVAVNCNARGTRVNAKTRLAPSLSETGTRFHETKCPHFSLLPANELNLKIKVGYLDIFREIIIN